MIELIRLSGAKTPRYEILPDGLYYHDGYIDYISGDLSFEIIQPVGPDGSRRSFTSFVFRSRARDSWYCLALDDLMRFCANEAPDALEWILFNLEILT